jgi:hypothetical protein
MMSQTQTSTKIIVYYQFTNALLLILGIKRRNLSRTNSFIFPNFLLIHSEIYLTVPTGMEDEERDSSVSSMAEAQ